MPRRVHGRIGHTELDLDGARWMMADEHPEIRVEAPAPGRVAVLRDPFGHRWFLNRPA